MAVAGAMDDGRIYVVIRSRDGGVVCRQYVDRSGLVDWLRRVVPDQGTCEVYDESPERGGRQVALLRGPLA